MPQQPEDHRPGHFDLLFQATSLLRYIQNPFGATVSCNGISEEARHRRRKAMSERVTVPVLR